MHRIFAQRLSGPARMSHFAHYASRHFVPRDHSVEKSTSYMMKNAPVGRESESEACFFLFNEEL